MLSELELRRKAKKFALEYWNLDFDLPIKVNSRLSITSAEYKYWEIDGEHIPRRIDISRNLLMNYKVETIFSILKHELCHWALATTNRPFADGHQVFEAELKRIGAVSTNTIEIAGEVHKGTCRKCDKIVVEGPTRRSLNPYLKEKSRYVSTCCKEKIVYSGTFFREDKNTSVACLLSRDFSSITRDLSGVLSSVNNNKEMGDGSMTTTMENTMKIEGLIQANKRGKVTNAQMIPALVRAIESESKEQLELLKEHYPEVFEASSSKYLNKTHKAAFEKILSGQTSEDQLEGQAV